MDVTNPKEAIKSQNGEEILPVIERGKKKMRARIEIDRTGCGPSSKPFLWILVRIMILRSRAFTPVQHLPSPVKKVPTFTLFSKFWVNKAVVRKVLEVLIVPESLEHYVDGYMSTDGLALYAE